MDKAEMEKQLKNMLDELHKPKEEPKPEPKKEVATEEEIKRFRSPYAPVNLKPPAEKKEETNTKPAKEETDEKPDKEPEENKQILSPEESAEEIAKYPKDAQDWLKNTEHSRPTKWGSKKAHVFSFSGNNYASLYRGKTFIRIIPFVKKTDLEAHLNWAQFYTNNWYDKPKEKLPWERAFLQIIWAPLNMSEDWAESIGGGGIHIKMDIDGQMQLPLYTRLTDDERAKLLKGNKMVGQALLLMAKFVSYTKKRVNIMFWVAISIVCGIGAIIILLFILFPNLGNQITGAFSGFANFIQPPAAPTAK